MTNQQLTGEWHLYMLCTPIFVHGQLKSKLTKYSVWSTFKLLHLFEGLLSLSKLFSNKICKLPDRCNAIFSQDFDSGQNLKHTT